MSVIEQEWKMKVSKEDKKIIHLVEDIAGTWVDHLHHNISMEEVGGDHVGNEGSVFLLEYDGNDIIPYVSLSL